MKRLENRARSAVAALGQRGRTTRIPDAVRDQVTAYSSSARSEGLGWKEIGTRVGLSGSVIQRWYRAARRNDAWSPVSVTDESDVSSAAKSIDRIALSTESAVLITPGGYRIEGLSLGALERLLAGLG